MRSFAAFSLLLTLFAFAAFSEDKMPILFGKVDLGKTPRGWSVHKTGTEEGSAWTVVQDTTTPGKSGFALRQMAESPKGVFNLCVLDDSKFGDGEIGVKFKADEGKIDRGGGLVWRYQDEQNYYVARFNPLEDNYRLYHVIDGKRTQFAGVEEIKIEAGKWHQLAVKVKGESIECWLDGAKKFEAKDATIAKAGKVGLWTKADARTLFDEFNVKTAGK